MKKREIKEERCAHCDIPVAAFRCERDGEVYCSAFCRERAPAKAEEVR